MRVKIKDTTKHADYGELYAGDVVEVKDEDAQRWVSIGLAEPTDADLKRRVAQETAFFNEQARQGGVYDAMVTRADAAPLGVGSFIGGTPDGASHPTNVAPEVQHILYQKDAEIAQLRPQLAGQDGAALPADETPADPLDGLPLTDAQKSALKEAGYDTPEKIAAASDDQLHGVPGVADATIAKLRG